MSHVFEELCIIKNVTTHCHFYKNHLMQPCQFSSFQNLTSHPMPVLTNPIPSVLQEYEVSLKKGEKGLGFTVAGGQQTTGYFYVKDVLYDPALSCGQIQPGDRLVRVRNWSLEIVFLYMMLVLYMINRCYMLLKIYSTWKGQVVPQNCHTNGRGHSSTKII